jgi:hypothetical protein
VVFPAFVIARSTEIARRQPLSSSARFVIAAAASVMFLKMAGLLHPAVANNDAVFNAPACVGPGRPVLFRAADAGWRDIPVYQSCIFAAPVAAHHRSPGAHSCGHGSR